jgi:hypothetical protein
MSNTIQRHLLFAKEVLATPSLTLYLTILSKAKGHLFDAERLPCFLMLPNIPKNDHSLIAMINSLLYNNALEKAVDQPFRYSQ